MSQKDVQATIIENLEKWKKVENASVESTGKVIAKTENPVIRMVMEIIQHDSQMHYRVQQYIIDSLRDDVVTLSPDDLRSVWDMVEKHIEIEKNTISLANTLLELIDGKSNQVQRYLIEYLLNDEKKHDTLLANMEKLKKGMYP